MSGDKLQRIHIVGGPTASGKSAKALQIAHEKDGVIINCDSMQIYDALPILSAQPSAEDQEAAPHLLYGHLHPNEDCSAGIWRRMAEPLIEQILAEGRTPIICGGTGLYIKALTHGLSPMPETPEDIREQTIALMEELGSPAFHAMLEKRDPLIKDRFHPNHSARLMRAYEVLESTGKSLAYWQSLPPEPPPDNWKFDIEIIIPPREDLYARCDRRFKIMLDMGALDEVRDFDISDIAEDALIRNALGYKPLRAHLNGELSLEDAIKQSQQDTRNYAKRQSTYFRNQF